MISVGTVVLFAVIVMNGRLTIIDLLGSSLEAGCTIEAFGCAGGVCTGADVFESPMFGDESLEFEVGIPAAVCLDFSFGSGMLVMSQPQHTTERANASEYFIVRFTCIIDPVWLIQKSVSPSQVFLAVASVAALRCCWGGRCESWRFKKLLK